MGPLSFCKDDIYIAYFYETFPDEKVTFHKGDLFDGKVLVKVMFNAPFLNLKGPISNTNGSALIYFTKSFRVI